MTHVYDITIPMTEQLAVWPGDTPYNFDFGWQMSEGRSVNVGAVTMSVHTGTHVDAPFHFDPAGASVDQLDLSIFLGPVVVIDATGLKIITREAFAGVDFTHTPRVLIRTGTWTDFSQFPENVPVLAEDVPAFLGKNGVVLFGVDVPSVDLIESKTLPNHHNLTAHGITILESANLRDVPPGIYTLTALPLRLTGADASPVRAILTTL